MFLARYTIICARYTIIYARYTIDGILKLHKVLCMEEVSASSIHKTLCNTYVISFLKLCKMFMPPTESH